MQEKEIFLKISFLPNGKISADTIPAEFLQNIFLLNEKKDKKYNEFLTNEEVAEILKTTKKRVIELRSRGFFPVKTYTKIDGIGYRFKKKELFDFLKISE
jgi:hypothetical protein